MGRDQIKQGRAAATDGDMPARLRRTERNIHPQVAQARHLIEVPVRRSTVSSSNQQRPSIQICNLTNAQGTTLAPDGGACEAQHRLQQRRRKGEQVAHVPHRQQHAQLGLGCLCTGRGEQTGRQPGGHVAMPRLDCGPCEQERRLGGRRAALYNLTARLCTFALCVSGACNPQYTTQRSTAQNSTAQHSTAVRSHRTTSMRCTCSAANSTTAQHETAHQGTFTHQHAVHVLRCKQRAQQDVCLVSQRAGGGRRVGGQHVQRHKRDGQHKLLGGGRWGQVNC